MSKPSTPAPDAVHSNGDGWKFAVIGLIAAALILFLLLPVMDWADDFNRSINHLERYGWWGVAAFVGIFTIATVLLMPSPILSLAGGVAFGFFQGFIGVSLGATLGAGAAFLIARYLAREKLRTMVVHRPKFIAIERAVSERGWKIVMLTRLSPVIPSNFQNYLYGLTSIRFSAFFVATWIGKIPTILMYIYLGAGGRAGLEAVGEGAAANPWQPYMYALGFIATAGGAWYISRIARNLVDFAPTYQEPETGTSKDPG